MTSFFLNPQDCISTPSWDPHNKCWLLRCVHETLTREAQKSTNSKCRRPGAGGRAPCTWTPPANVILYSLAPWLFSSSVHDKRMVASQEKDKSNPGPKPTTRWRFGRSFQMSSDTRGARLFQKCWENSTRNQVKLSDQCLTHTRDAAVLAVVVCYYYDPI